MTDEPIVGFAVGVGRVARGKHVALIRTCVPRPASSWAINSSSSIAVVDVQRLQGAVPYASEGGLVVPSLFARVY